MDVAYDHITENSFPKTKEESEEGKQENKGAEKPEPTLNEDFQEAYKAFSASPWGSRIGGFFGNVVKQVCTTPSSLPAAHRTRGCIVRNRAD